MGRARLVTVSLSESEPGIESLENTVRARHGSYSLQDTFSDLYWINKIMDSPDQVAETYSICSAVLHRICIYGVDSGYQRIHLLELRFFVAKETGSITLIHLFINK